MATITGFTAARMQAIEDNTIVSGAIVGDDLILTKNDTTTVNAGDVRGPAGPEGPPGGLVEINMSYAGALAVVTGKIRWYASKPYSISKVLISVGTAPTGAGITVDVKKNGTTIFTTPSNRPTIPADAFFDESATPDVTSIIAGDYLTVDIVSVGSTILGENLGVQIVVA